MTTGYAQVDWEIIDWDAVEKEHELFQTAADQYGIEWPSPTQQIEEEMADLEAWAHTMSNLTYERIHKELEERLRFAWN